MQLLDQLAQLSHEALLDYAMRASVDQHTGYILGSAAIALHPTITPGRKLVYVDFCNVHACNHANGGMERTNEQWMASFDMRAGDVIIKWGGDEIAVLLDDEDAQGYVDRLSAAMRENNVYAVIGVVTTSAALYETIMRADRLVTSVKNHLETTGQKPHRDAPYVCLDSYIIHEEESNATLIGNT